MAVCEEHSSVMKCLGSLEEGQRDVKMMLRDIDNKLSNMQVIQQNGRVSAAIEKTKGSLIYWVIGIGGAALIVGLINIAIKEGPKYFR